VNLKIHVKFSIHAKNFELGTNPFSAEKLSCTDGTLNIPLNPHRPSHVQRAGLDG
jgi:hypothetical protein